MIIDDMALPLVAGRARELAEIVLPYAALVATFVFLGAVAAGIVH